MHLNLAGECMFRTIFSFLSSFALVFVLHVANGNAFPEPLSKKKEEQQIALMRAGDKNARNTLIEHNLRLVAHIVKKYANTPYDQDDLVSIGTLGLIKAIDSFNPDKSIKLSSYAARCIENEILMHFRSQKKSAFDVSLDEAIETDKDGNHLTLMDILSANDNVEEMIDLKINSEKIYHYINELSVRERNIIIMRYGLFGETPLTQKETAEKLKISRSYVSRIEKRALKKLLDMFEEQP